MSRFEEIPKLYVIVVFLLLSGGISIAAPFADYVVYNWDGTTASYAPGTGDNMTFGPFHSSGLWNDPQAVLGKLNTLDKDDTDWNPSTCEFREIIMVWPAWYQGTNQANAANTNYASNPTGAPKVNNGCGLKGGAQIVVEFDEVITDDPYNPYGIDLVVHGNPFFATGNTVYKDTNMEEYTLTSYANMGAGAVFEERVTVSVAQSLDGPWYTYETAFGDWFFPTQPFAWDRDATDWSNQEQDWTKPVNPSLVDLQNEAASVGTGTYTYFGGRPVADAIDLYTDSAGGTGFDLAESGFEWIKYVKLTDPNNKQGEICGVADIAPVTVGDRLSICPENIDDGTAQLSFQKTGDLTTCTAEVAFSSIDNVAQVSVSELLDLAGYAPITGPDLGAYLVEIDKVFSDEGPVSFNADLALRVSDLYVGDGSDLLVLHWNGLSWEELTPSGYDAMTQMVSMDGVTSFSPFVVTLVPEPATFVLLSGGAVLCALRRSRR